MCQRHVTFFSRHPCAPECFTVSPVFNFVCNASVEGLIEQCAQFSRNSAICICGDECAWSQSAPSVTINNVRISDQHVKTMSKHRKSFHNVEQRVTFCLIKTQGLRDVHAMCRPCQQLRLNANSCNVHCTTHRGQKKGREHWNNKLISPLFENITTLAQLHQFTRATEETSHNSIGHGTQVPPATRANVNSSVMNTCHITRTDSRGDVSCMAEIPIDLNTPPQPCDCTLA